MENFIETPKCPSCGAGVEEDGQECDQCNNFFYLNNNLVEES